MKRILTLGLVALGIMVQAQEKVLLSTDNSGNKFYIYPSTIRKSDYGFTIWREMVFATPQLLAGTKKYYTINKYQSLIDCNGMKDSFIAFTLYSKDGNAIGSHSQSEYKAYIELKPVAPDTIGWGIIEEICRRYNQDN